MGKDKTMKDASSFKSISFRLKEHHEPFVIDFDVIGMDILCTIARILDIEGHHEVLVVDLDYDVYMEVKDFIIRDSWLAYTARVEYGKTSIRLNGFDIIFKLKA